MAEYLECKGGTNWTRERGLRELSNLSDEIPLAMFLFSVHTSDVTRILCKLATRGGLWARLTSRSVATWNTVRPMLKMGLAQRGWSLYRMQRCTDIANNTV